MPDENVDVGMHPQDTSKKDLLIIGAKDLDKLGTVHWKDYTNKKNLSRAWGASGTSPYDRFIKTRTIDSVDQLSTALKPRYSEGEEISERAIQQLIESGNVGQNTAIILDSGGAHSVAMGFRLAEHGYQPIVMLDTAVSDNGSVKAEQHLATMLYFAEAMNQLRQTDTIKPNAPPVFILDIHRTDKAEITRDIDNSYTYTVEDFPSAEELTQHGITKVIYINENDHEGAIGESVKGVTPLPDTAAVIHKWQTGGIEIKYTGIDPWKGTARRLDPYSPEALTRVLKSLFDIPPDLEEKISNQYRERDKPPEVKKTDD